MINIELLTTSYEDSYFYFAVGRFEFQTKRADFNGCLFRVENGEYSDGKCDFLFLNGLYKYYKQLVRKEDDIDWDVG